MAFFRTLSGAASGGNANLPYYEYEISTLENGTIDTSRGGCWYVKYGNIVHLHLAVKDLTVETTTRVFTMPEGSRPPHSSAFGLGVGADRTKIANVSVGAVSGACNLWSESTTAQIDLEYTVDDQGGSGIDSFCQDVSSLITPDTPYTFSGLTYKAVRIGNMVFLRAEANVDGAPAVGTGYKIFDIDSTLRPSAAHCNWCWGASSSNAVVSISSTGTITVTAGAWFRFEAFWFIGS